MTTKRTCRHRADRGCALCRKGERADASAGELTRRDATRQANLRPTRKTGLNRQVCPPGALGQSGALFEDRLTLLHLGGDDL
ncbi:MAG: hypothetical protein ABJJ54_03925, partial [Sulfitobacter pontiacus]|uniref:hypothetical protein n=1 Tax=Sulfitobacter pontiacus TaxID=60137 RepID=UPI0032981890